MLFIQIALQIRKTWRKKNKKHAVRCHGEVTKVRLAYWRSESNLYSERLIIKVPDSTPRRNPGCVYRLDRDRRWLIFSLLCQGLSFFRKRSAGRVLFISFPSSAHVPDDIPDLASGLSSSSCRVCTPVYSCGFVAGPWELFDPPSNPPKKIPTKIRFRFGRNLTATRRLVLHGFVGYFLIGNGCMGEAFFGEPLRLVNFLSMYDEFEWKGESDESSRIKTSEGSRLPKTVLHGISPERENSVKAPLKISHR